MHPIQLTEKRIDSAIEAMNNSKRGTWAHNYWSNVVGYLLRKLNGEIHEANTHQSTASTRYWTH